MAGSLGPGCVGLTQQDWQGWRAYQGDTSGRHSSKPGACWRRDISVCAPAPRLWHPTVVAGCRWVRKGQQAQSAASPEQDEPENAQEDTPEKSPPPKSPEPEQDQTPPKKEKGPPPVRPQPVTQQVEPWGMSPGSQSRKVESPAVMRTCVVTH